MTPPFRDPRTADEPTGSMRSPLSGQRLGAFEIEALIGAGGMGEVYRAYDTQLNRFVAIKTLPERFSDDPERLARFEREARLLAAVNHPHIATIHDVVHVDGLRAIVLELVEGETLAQRIRRGPIAAREVVAIARQIADALDAAHGKGIVHRDLKPANIKITPTGTVKVLDFGLATIGADGSAAEPADTPTITLGLTGRNGLLGTAAYLSPEQARGQPVDKRADVWAFGCVLYEMLTGQSVFGAESASDSIAAILTAEPDWSLIPAATPPPLRRLVRRCVEKDLGRRLRDIADARLDLDDAAGGAMDGAGDDRNAPSQAPPRGRMLAITLCAACIAGSLGWLLRGRAPEPLSPVTSLSLLFAHDRPEALHGAMFALSPDGAAIVYVGNEAGSGEQLFIRRLDGFSGVPLTDTAGAHGPTFSPDGRWIAFGQDFELKKMLLAGGAPITLAPIGRAGGFDWGPSDEIVYSQLTDGGQAIFSVPASGGRPRPIIAPAAGSTDFVLPQWLSNGQAMVFTRIERAATGSRVTLMASRPPGAAPHVVLENALGGRVDGRLLTYVRGHSLMAIPFDPGSLRPSGQARAIVDVAVERGNRYWALFGRTLAYAPFARGTNELVWVDQAGDVQALAMDPGQYDDPRVSPDGSRIAMTVTTDGASDVWVYDLAQETRTEVTHDGSSGDAVWTPDGAALVYASRRSTATTQIYRQPLDGSGEPQLVVASESMLDQVPCSWSADGRQLAVWRSSTDSNRNGLWVFDAVRRSASPIVTGPGVYYDGQLSPDGRWIAYLARQGERFVALVTSTRPGGPTTQISKGEASELIWTRAGGDIFYRSGRDLIRHRVHAGDRFVAERPEVVLRGDFVGSPTSPGYVHYDVPSSGQRFLMIRQSSRFVPHLNVIRGFSDVREAATP